MSDRSDQLRRAGRIVGRAYNALAGSQLVLRMCQPRLLIEDRIDALAKQLQAANPHNYLPTALNSV